MRVLVIDDEMPVGELVQEILTGAGHEVDLVHNGADALRDIQAIPYDGVVLDVRMPGMSGIDVFEALRALRPSLAARAVFMCADRGVEIQRQLAALGRPVIDKPFEAPVLVDAVRSMAKTG